MGVSGYTKQGADDEFIDEDELTAETSGLAPKTALLNALPATVGASGQVLKSNGTGVVWQADSVSPATATQAQAEAGTATTVLGWTPERVRQAISALAPVKVASGTMTIPTPPTTGTYTLRVVDGALTWIEEI